MRPSEPERSAGGRPLEGPGSEARLQRLNARFRALSRAMPRTHRPDRTRLGLRLWIAAWAACALAAVWMMLNRGV